MSAHNVTTKEQNPASSRGTGKSAAGDSSNPAASLPFAEMRINGNLGGSLLM